MNNYYFLHHNRLTRRYSADYSPSLHARIMQIEATCCIELLFTNLPSAFDILYFIKWKDPDIYN